MTDDTEQAKNLGGRPTKYTPEIGAEICRRLEGGETLTAIVRDLDVADVSTVYRWRDQDEWFRAAFYRARDIGGEAMIYRAVDETFSAHDRDDATVRKVRADAMFRAASMFSPGKYHAKANVTVQVTKDARDLSDEELAAIASNSSK